MEAADDKDSLISRYNDFQEFAAKTITLKLLEKLKPEDIVVLCSYIATRDALRKALEEAQIRVHKIDGFQGKEAPIVILITTRVISDQTSEESARFFDDEQRIRVALSRAKDGIII
ncbi:unnamed protein product [Anisakis simplex]|uniref:AAA_12 domain-containing protein n=1 Tax=Anisakis simplex TaxID=6269 RepID=A0A0M3JHA6_ANISI|nr:unnamed protein product [Anisakis simplex]